MMSFSQDGWNTITNDDCYANAKRDIILPNKKRCEVRGPRCGENKKAARRAERRAAFIIPVPKAGISENQLVMHKLSSEHQLSVDCQAVNKQTGVDVFGRIFSMKAIASHNIVLDYGQTPFVKPFRKLNNLSINRVEGSDIYKSKVSFKCPPSPSVIILIRVDSRISLASFSILQI